PGIARRFFKRDERAHKWNKNRRADFESELFGDKQMAGFVYQQKQDKTKGELPAPNMGIDPDHQQHRSAGFQQDRQEFQKRKKSELQSREKVRDQNSDCCKRSQRFFYSAPGRFLGRSFVLLGWFSLKVHRFADVDSLNL